MQAVGHHGRIPPSGRGAFPVGGPCQVAVGFNDCQCLGTYFAWMVAPMACLFCSGEAVAAHLACIHGSPDNGGCPNAKPD